MTSSYKIKALVIIEEETDWDLEAGIYYPPDPRLVSVELFGCMYVCLLDEDVGPASPRKT